MDLLGLYAKFRKTVESKFKFASVVTVDGQTLEYEGELIAGETLVYIVTEEGQSPAPDGEHTLSDGTVLTVEGGIVTVITKAANGEQEMKKSRKRFKGVRKMAEEGAALEVEEITVVAEEIAVGEDVVVIDEQLNVLEDFTGEIVVDEEVVVIEEGEITEVGEATEMKKHKFMAEVAAADGTMLLIDPAVEVGAMVSVMTTDGNVAIETQTIELANGQVIEVVDGRIDAISSIEGMKKKVAAQRAAAKIEVHRTEVERRFAAMDNVINSMAEVVGAMVEKLNDIPVEPVKDKFSQEKRPVDNSEKFASMIKQLNNKK
jgi:hypothetical protein